MSRNGLPDGLLRVEKVIDVPEEERQCSCCGELFKPIGDERSEQLHFKPMELYVVVQVLKKYMATCPCSDKRSASAEPPIRPIDKGIASTSLLSIIAVMKYLDHLPLARQATHLFRRSGVELSQSSMCRWMGNIADMLFPLSDLMHTKLLESFVLQVDSTSVKYIDAVPVLNDIFSWCLEHREKFLPKDPMTGAMQYALNHEGALRRYCEDDRLEIDNNAAERILRLIAIGRKNWLFYGSERGGRTGAVLHSVLASAKRNGLNEFVYLCDVLDRLADLGSHAELHELLPDKWMARN